MKLIWKPITECDDDNGQHTVWSTEVNHPTYGKYLWISIDGYSVDGFTVIPCFRGKSVEITFFRFVKPSGYENKCSYEIPTEIRSQCYMKIISKLKRCSFVDGKVIISISGQKYCIGTYTTEI